MTVTFTSGDEGRVVVDASGDALGLVTRVEADRAYVEPTPGLPDAPESALVVGEADADDEYVVDRDAVERRTRERLHLRRDL